MAASRLASRFNREDLPALTSPIMEILTGIMIAILIFYSGKLIMNEQLSLNNFFSFLAAMMLAYQPVKSLAQINVGVGQGLSAGKRILPIIDTKNYIETNENKENLDINCGEIEILLSDQPKYIKHIKKKE